MAARALGRARLNTWDALPVALALAHGALLLALPSIPLVAVGLWWNANTISHHFIHRPFFRSRTLNACFSSYLSLVLGFPQSLWRARHLAHHRAMEGGRGRSDLKPAPLDFGAVVALWGALLVLVPGFLLTIYLPGFVLGLGLCYLQGHYEHPRGAVSHYGWLYNFLMFNDGYHVEHHARPAANWRELPRHRASHSNASRWPPVLRWLEFVNLCALERMVLRFRALQRFVLCRHERAFRSLLVELTHVSRI
ncbi:MAG TPA: fatty acid desaturase, partial [Blastocatellia bacterium]|nr:fatty acid desaturase [Blastocatellia bacterium]